MPKAIYIPWTESEEALLLGWLAQHKRLSWEEKSEKYTDDFGMPRTPESLRGKYNQLLKGIRRQRVIPRHFTTSRRERPKQARRKSSRRRSTLQMPTSPPRLGLRDNDAAAEQKLEGLKSNFSFVKKGLNLDGTVQSNQRSQTERRHQSMSRRSWKLLDRILETRLSSLRAIYYRSHFQ